MLDKTDSGRHALPPDFDVYVTRDYRDKPSRMNVWNGGDAPVRADTHQEHSNSRTNYSHYSYTSVAIHAEHPRWPAAHVWRGNIHEVACTSRGQFRSIFSNANARGSRLRRAPVCRKPPAERVAIYWPSAAAAALVTAAAARRRRRQGLLRELPRSGWYANSKTQPARPPCSRRRCPGLHASGWVEPLAQAARTTARPPTRPTTRPTTHTQPHTPNHTHACVHACVYRILYMHLHAICSHAHVRVCVHLPCSSRSRSTRASSPTASAASSTPPTPPAAADSSSWRPVGSLSGANNSLSLSLSLSLSVSLSLSLSVSVSLSFSPSRRVHARAQAAPGLCTP